jgi:hypothetical protein
MSLKPYATVRLLTDRYYNKGVVSGNVGTILEVYEDGGYEVEFSHPDGTTIAWFAVAQNEIALFEPILLEADVQPFFPNAQSVNDALRLLIELSQQTEQQIDLRQLELLRNIQAIVVQ